MRTTRAGLLAALLSAAVAAGCTGCGAIHQIDRASAAPPQHAGASSSPSGRLGQLLPDRIRSAGRIVVVTDPTYPPFESLSADQQTVTGLDPDLLHALAGELGVRIELKRAGFDTIIPGLQAGRYDMAMSGMTDIKARQSQVTFVDYLAVGGAVLMAKGDPLAGRSDVRTALCGRRVGVQTGTITISLSKAQTATCTKEHKAPIHLSTFPSVPSALMALSSGRVGYVWTDGVSGATEAKQSAGRFMSVPDGTPTSPTGMVFPKASTGLITALQRALQALIDNGTYRQILEKYGLQGDAVTAARVNGAKQ